MNDGAPLNVDFNKKTKLTPAGKKTIMPVTLQGQQIIPKDDIKPKPKPKPKKQGKLPNDKRTNTQRMKDFNDCVNKKCDCHGKKNKWTCCKQCRNQLKKRIPTNADGVPIYKLTQAYKTKNGSQ